MNRIEPEPVPLADCPVVTDSEQIAGSFYEYLGDESRLRAASVAAIYLPESTGQVAGALASLAASGRSCTLSAGRTGITGAAVPVGADAIISLARMKRILAFGRDGEEWYLRAEPGLSLDEIREALARRELGDLAAASQAEQDAAGAYAAGEGPDLWFPVDPTETTAHLGGIVATNASGARSLRHGPTRAWIRGLAVVLADGRLLRLRRGEVLASGNRFVLVRADGSEAALDLPDLAMPDTKCTAGYFLAPGMDLVDLFVGSEGTLGAVVEVELRLAARPASQVGVLAVVAGEDKALDLVEAARGSDAIKCDAIEYFDRASLQLLKSKKEQDGPGSHVPELPSWEGAAVYLEVAGSEEETEAACEVLEQLLAGVGSSIDETWAAMEPDELERQKLVRHSVPEAVNSLIGQRAARQPGLHKVGTDMAVPDAKLRDVFAMYRQGLLATGLDSVVFGHIGDNHVHVNILPRDLAELQAAKTLYQEWAAAVVAMGGAVAAEHGIGRIKKSMLAIQYPAKALCGMRSVRQALDPRSLLGPGVLL